ncbi:hypothetical protein KX816_18885 [Sphingosinicellaceae bacterium]|nr:hypothetical protein KX816_18885 [Sphingosinicellaceae bacterium]
MEHKPTFDDFNELARRTGLIASRHLERSVKEMIGVNAASGRLNSGMTVKRALSLLEAATIELVDDSLAELKRFRSRSNLDAAELRHLTGLSLTETYKTMSLGVLTLVKSINLGPSAVTVLDDKINDQWEYIRFRLRQSNLGVDEFIAVDPQPITNNTIHAHGIIGGMQQGTSRSTMTIENHLDNVAIERAVKAAEDALIGCDNSPLRSDVEGDLATIKAQLQKPSPVASILRETGKSLRNLTEGVAAGLLTAPAQTALLALASISGG